MTRHQAAVLACRILAIYAIINALIALQGVFEIPQMLGHFEYSSIKWTIASILEPVILLTLFGLWIWFGADKLAVHMAPGPDLPVAQSGLSRTDVQVVAFSVAGLVFVMRSMPSICCLAVHLLVEGRHAGIDGEQILGAIISGVQMALGIMLIVGARAFPRKAQAVTSTED